VFVIGRIRGWFEGAGWFLAVAGGLFAVALLVLFGFLQTDTLLWTGTAVTGANREGIVFYQWHGQTYTLDGPATTTPTQTTVYIDPGNPSNGVIDSTSERLMDVLGVVVPVGAGIVVLVIGGTRNYRWKRRNEKQGTSDWWLARVPRSGDD
jgi:hypothetical protein